MATMVKAGKGPYNRGNWYKVFKGGKCIGEVTMERLEGSGRQFSMCVGYMPTTYQWQFYAEDDGIADELLGGFHAKDFDSFKDAKAFVEGL